MRSRPNRPRNPDRSLDGSRQPPMQLLLTNDDGVHAEGLACLQRSMTAFGDVVILAPSEPYSNCGHQITIHRPLTVERLAEGRYALDGSPADCARLGLVHLQPDTDWLVSGINAGGNLGIDLYMSGTVAAAREAALLGFRAIAFSQYRRRGRHIDWDWAGRMAARVFRHVLSLPLPPAHFWNVNLPDPGQSAEQPEIIRCDPDGHPLAVAYELDVGKYHYRGVYQARKHHPDSDVAHCFTGKISLSQVACGILASNSSDPESTSR